MKEELIDYDTAVLVKQIGFTDFTKSPDNIPTHITQSLVQKYLREKHKLDVFCDGIGSGLYLSVIYDNNTPHGFIDKVFEQENETPYEIALGIGLKEALKRLTISKKEVKNIIIRFYNEKLKDEFLEYGNEILNIPEFKHIYKDIQNICNQEDIRYIYNIDLNYLNEIPTYSDILVIDFENNSSYIYNYKL